MKTKLAKTAHTGTAYYMAPERYSSTAGYHFGSDIWSLGCILYEMATLRSPFAGEQSSEYALQKRITTGEILPIATDYYSRYVCYPPNFSPFLTSYIFSLIYSYSVVSQLNLKVVQMPKMPIQLLSNCIEDLKNFD